MASRSRYDGVEVATVEVADGAGGTRQVSYLRRRRPGAPGEQPTLALHRVSEDDRLDLVAARYYGDSTAWWRICDANAALDPDAMVAPDAAGTVLVVPLPGV
jgi:hypothetical protein